MLGRQVTLLLLLRAPASSRLPRAAFLGPLRHDLCTLGGHRTYSTPGRPKKAVGEPSRPVKRSVTQASAAKPSSTPTKTSSRAKAKRGSATAKKPAAKAKPKKPKKAKPTLSPERQEAKRTQAKALKEKEAIKKLKALALDPPTAGSVSSYNTYVKEKLSGVAKDGPVPDRMRAVSAEFKNLTPAELEHYNHLAHTQREERHAAYKRWVESHQPAQIKAANSARRSLRLRLKVPPRSRKWAAIPDERAVKRPMTPFIHFSTARHGSPDFNKIALVDRGKLIAKEWKDLETSEKEKYISLYNKENERYISQYNEIYGQPPSSTKASTATAAA